MSGRPPARLGLEAAVARLEDFYGTPAPPPTTDPFALVVLENAAYLVGDARRLAVFARLREETSLVPEALLSLAPVALARLIHDGGMLPEHRAEKLRAAALTVLEIDGGAAGLREEVAGGRGSKLLRRFPGIGEPGADKIQLLARVKRTLAPDSNALRVLVRLGYGEESGTYTHQYRSAAAAVAPELPDDFAWLIRAHQLLRRHGQELCKRNAPRCSACPLTRSCRYYLAATARCGR